MPKAVRQSRTAFFFGLFNINSKYLRYYLTSVRTALLVTFVRFIVATVAFVGTIGTVATAAALSFLFGFDNGYDCAYQSGNYDAQHEYRRQIDGGYQTIGYTKHRDGVAKIHIFQFP